MTVQKLNMKPGINREITRYASEGGWYECNFVRFRFGHPEKIGGWQQVSTNTYLGTARSLTPWVTLAGISYIGVGTNLKYYVSTGGAYFDITPIRLSTTAGAVTFAATNGSAIITVTNTAHGALIGDFVTFTSATGLGGNITAAVLNQEYQILTVPSANTYTISAKSTTGVTVLANASDTGNGGAGTVAAYQLNTGSAIQLSPSGWGSGTWGSGVWGAGTAVSSIFGLWNASNFGEDLIFGPYHQGLYYWYGAGSTSTRGVPVASLSGASDVPTIQNLLLVSDASEFVLVFGTNRLGTSIYDAMLIRWSDQQSVTVWTPLITNQAGDLRLSRGSSIIARRQTRQEILVWTDVALYSLQYLGPPVVWGSSLMADNISIAGPNVTAFASGVVYWMGNDKFYMYNGTVNTLPCTLRDYVFNNLNRSQRLQFFAGTVEQFNEVWWFYCSTTATVVDSYVIFNYLENIWYYGNFQTSPSVGRTAWLDNWVGSEFPLAATYYNNLVYHELGTDDEANSTAYPMNTYLTSSEFGVDAGDRFGFIWRMLPDITFVDSEYTVGYPNPQVTMTLSPMQNSGSGYNNPLTEGGTNQNNLYPVERVGQYTVDQFTGQINTRVRGRQFTLTVSSNLLGTAWRLGIPRIDVRPDGRRG